MIDLVEEKLAKNDSLSKDELVFLFNYILDKLKIEYNVDAKLEVMFLKEYVDSTFYEKNLTLVKMIEKLSYKGYCLTGPEQNARIVINGIFYNVSSIKNKILNKNNTNLVFIHTLLHEFWHSVQYNNIRKNIDVGIFDEQVYRVLNSFIISDLSFDYYIENHSLMESEIDANEKAFQLFLDNIERPIFRVFKDKKALITDKKNKENEKRKSKEYRSVNDFLTYFEPDEIKSPLLNTFTVMEYNVFKDKSIKELVVAQKEIEEMLLDNYQDNDILLKNHIKSNNDFFEYFIFKKITNLNDEEKTDFVNNIDKAVAMKIRNIFDNRLPHLKENQIMVQKKRT